MPAKNNNIFKKICVLFLFLLLILGLLITGGFLPDQWVVGLIKSGWGLALVVFLIILVIVNNLYPISASKDTDNQE